jgi:hypothetical protein
MKVRSPKRFPQSVKEIRRKFPHGTTVQARFVTERGSVIEWEGMAGEEFLRFHYAVLVGGKKCCCGHVMHEGRMCGALKPHAKRSGSIEVVYASCRCDGHDPDPEGP